MGQCNCHVAIRVPLLALALASPLRHGLDFKYFPDNMAAVSGIVGMAGGLGGFLLPIVFGVILDRLGVNSSWLHAALRHHLGVAHSQLPHRSAPRTGRGHVNASDDRIQFCNCIHNNAQFIIIAALSETSSQPAGAASSDGAADSEQSSIDAPRQGTRTGPDGPL